MRDKPVFKFDLWSAFLVIPTAVSGSLPWFLPTSQNWPLAYKIAICLAGILFSIFVLYIRYIFSLIIDNNNSIRQVYLKMELEINNIRSIKGNIEVLNKFILPLVLGLPRARRAYVAGQDIMIEFISEGALNGKRVQLFNKETGSSIGIFTVVSSHSNSHSAKAEEIVGIEWKEAVLVHRELNIENYPIVPVATEEGGI